MTRTRGDGLTREESGPATPRRAGRPTRRLAEGVRKVWIDLGIALLMLAVLEAGLQASFVMKDRTQGVSSIVALPRLQAAHPGEPWVAPYRGELLEALQPAQWRSYVYWRARPYLGKYITIDGRGLRQTWNATPARAPNQPQIFMFGGSTMWGYGARDDFTIPSLLSRRLAGLVPTAPWIVNFGEAGYVSTQELITLMLELQRGNIPDLVIFYDGVNDAWAAFQSGVAGVPQNEINRIVEFNLRHRLNWREGLLYKLGLYRLARGVQRTFWARTGPSERRFLDVRMAEAVVDVYLQNVRLVNTLAKEYGFRAVFFWQPTIFTKQVLSPEEERWGLLRARRPGRSAPPFASEYRAFNDVFQQRLRISAIPNVHDLSGIFAPEPRTIFIDRFHISERGNAHVAEAMARVMVDVMAQPRASR